ncbi:BaiN/RdsA family NAD(P)/FAD-dependent oxidoreductase [Roseivirga echinicomitans]|uniref:Flavoprotein n=1 Tax=Roseivirga echinicomitans TaxID=296218 RepID=A0A150XPT3_9BACT|nr:NAD(P)/FAD-dependent oxidoreductase [Roseivirga echinicomitans]KYG80759.1 flavoprotein [Roseivirga echinicomitans]
MPQNIAVIGGGAAGFFAAFSCKVHLPDASVTIFEKTGKLLSKVKVSGGGRCNVTHACFNNNDLVKFYPRGGKQLKKVFGQFTTTDTVAWFEERGVELKAEADNRMFPTTDSSQTIIDCFLRETDKLGIQVVLNANVNSIQPKGSGFDLQIGEKIQHFDKVIVASGGSPKAQGFDWLKDLGHEIITPVPSLFTFNMPKEPIKNLMGLSVPNATVRVQGTKLQQSGPLLITHWGMSGPAILKTSAWGARVLADLGYNFKIQVNWLGAMNEEELRTWFVNSLQSIGKRKIRNKNPLDLPNRLWDFFLEKVEVDGEGIWAEIGKKNLNRLINLLLNDTYEVKGKTTFKEEFVTSGGVVLADVDFNTMESRKCSGLFFAGEVIDVDGVTGGFNFQAAWSTGFVAGKS